MHCACAWEHHCSPADLLPATQNGHTLIATCCSIIAPPGAPGHFPMCSPEQLGAALAPHLPWCGAAASPQHGNSKPKRSRTYQATGRMCCGILGPRVREGVVWCLEFLSRQVQAACSSSLLALTLPGRRECQSRLRCSKRGMLTPVNAAVCAQALLLCPATPTDVCSLPPAPSDFYLSRSVEVDFRGVLRFAQSCFQGSSGW